MPRLALLTLVLSLPSAVAAEFKIVDIQPRFVGEALMVNGILDLELTPKVEEALAKGIELSLIVEVQLHRKRPLLWDERLAAWSLRRSLQYHALSGQYLVGSGNARDSFLSLAEALKNLGTLSELRLPLREVELAAAADYRANLRARLDFEALPAPLRPVAYTSLSWYLNSGWTTWNVAR